jgi:hypothetical protein
MPPILEQLSFGLPEPASDRLEQLLAEEQPAEAAEELDDAA